MLLFQTLYKTRQRLAFTVAAALAVISLVFVGATPAHAVDGVPQTINKITYKTLQGEATIVGTVGITSGPVDIPSTILGNIPVVAIASNAFVGAVVGAVSIPSSVISIGTSAFSATSMTSLTLARGLKQIGHSAFAYNSLTEVLLPDTLLSMDEYAFGSNQISSIVIPASVTFAKYPFDKNPLGYAEFAEGTITVPENIFWENAAGKLLTVKFPQTVTSIGRYAFLLTPLHPITLPSGLKEIGFGAFEVTGLAAIEIPASVISIGEAAFDTQVTTVFDFKGAAPVMADNVFGDPENPNSGTFTIRHTTANAYTFVGSPWDGYTLVPYLGENSRESSAATTIAPGTRTANLSDIIWDTTAPNNAWAESNLKFSHASTSISGTTTLTVDDASGSGAGWAITVIATNFIWNKGSAGTATEASAIPANQMTFEMADVAKVGTSATTPTKTGETFPLATTPTTLLNAVKDVNASEGKYTSFITVGLTVPANARAGNYTSTLTTTMSVSP